LLRVSYADPSGVSNVVREFEEAASRLLTYHQLFERAG
jgi:hypothetical protein